MQEDKPKSNETATAARESPPGMNLSVETDSQENEDDTQDNKQQRQDLFVCFTNDKDLRHHETISIKASLYKGIAVRVKILNHIWMENILFAIETAQDLGIVNLRFEECQILKKAVVRLIEFLKTTEIIESFGLLKVTFDDSQDFKRLAEAVQLNQSIKQFAVNHADFNEDFYGKTLAKCVLESTSLKEIDMSFVQFRDQRSFYEMANGLLHERCKLGALKLRGISFNQLEGQVMQFILTKNQSLQTLDISQCSTENPEILENVFLKFDQSCTIKTLVVENSETDFNNFIEAFGEALGQNTHLEGLSLKENALKQTEYCLFWELMSENRSLQKINLQKTEVTNKVCHKLGSYLMQPGISLHDLNLSKNSIEAEGLIALAQALHTNTSILKLNLAQNLIQDSGLEEFVKSLKVNTTLRELCLSLNKINNIGLEAFSGFLAKNQTLTVLDLSKNQFSDFGFVHFAKQLAFNKGIESLNLQKNKDVTDDVGLRELAQALAVNASLAIIDLSGLKIRKPCIIQYFQPALQSNITLKKILGKIPQGIISDDLKDNVTIEADITNKYKTVNSSSKRQHSQLPLNQHQGDYTYLDLSNSANELLTPALKFIRYRCIHGVNLSNMQLEDESLRLLSLYLEENPILRSLAIADNYFTDDGLGQLILALRGNTHLNHLDIQGCTLISSLSVRALDGMVTEVNMSLYTIELERDLFDPSLVKSVLTQARYNKAIQMHLKPTKLVNDDGLIQIKFVKGASIAEYFDAALKSWRIMGPTMIKAVNEGLEDAHVIQLCDFLSNRNMIKSLNLRRNKIGNKGAIAIANFIRKSDKTLQILELERNQIQDEGGEELLRATQSNMRIEFCNMSFGNPMRQKICRQVEREIQANLQIKAQVVPVYKQQKNSLPSYEESDRGPDFARCALKSCELFKILHLSLPDNMIGLKEVIDISYVLAKNTPLRTLNLSQNAIDAKAALILTEGLAANSHLREVDLRQNILEDSGIAVLLRPFIMQKIDRFSPKQERLSRLPLFLKNKKSPTQQVGYEIPQLLKMKIDRLHLDQNNQTGEALKHVYTTLIINEDIEISIDLPEMIPIDTDERSVDTKFSEESESDDSEEEKKDTSPVGNQAVLPIQKQGTSVVNSLATSQRVSRQNSLALSRQGTSVLKKPNEKPEQKIQKPEQEDPATQAVESPTLDKNTEDNNAEEQPILDEFELDQSEPEGFVDMAKLPEKKKAIPFICQLRCCSRCRKLRYRNPEKPKKTCIQLCCPSFFVSRASSNRFKMSQELLQSSEDGIQIKLFLTFIFQIILYTLFGILVPLLLRNDNERCQPFLPIQVYICYMAYITIIVTLEFRFFKVLSTVLHHKDGPQSKCNAYLIAKGIQGQLANLSTFIQIGFCAHVLACNQSQKQSLVGETDSIQPDEQQSAVWQQVSGYILAIVSGLIITTGNYNRLKYILIYSKPQPHIHTILPNTYRNIQFAWICNMQSIAVILESTSLSEYMNELGGPITKSKTKEFLRQNLSIKSQTKQDFLPKIEEKLEVRSISEQLVSNKLKFQDLPMLMILVVYFLTHINVLTEFDMIVFAAKIGLVGLATASSYLSHKWLRNPKRVDYKLIQEIIDERIQKRIKIEEAQESNDKAIKIEDQKLAQTQSHETQGSAAIDMPELNESLKKKRTNLPLKELESADEEKSEEDVFSSEQKDSQDDSILSINDGTKED